MSIAAAIKAAARASERSGGITITISRGDSEILDVACGLGSSTFETLGPDNSVVTVRSQDFLLRKELYDFGDGPVEPARGDRVTLSQEDGDHVYELLDLASEPSWRWSDPHRVRLRLHTKEIIKPS
jgi:hypothetical protein